MNIFKKISIAVAGTIAIALGIVGSVQAQTVSSGGGDVLPPDAISNGYSLTDFAKLIAPFSPGTHTVEIKGEFNGAALDGLSFSPDIIYTVQSTPVPEPSSVIGVLAFGTFAAGSLIERQRKRKAKGTV